MTPKPHSSVRDRLETGVKGLDQLINGGLRTGGTYLLLGAPGNGKTILANQIAFHEIKKGGRAVYVTLLAESHSRMMLNLGEMDFFDANVVSKQIQYMNAYGVLERDGLDGLMKLLGDLIVKHKASVLFIDGVASADALAGSSEQFKRFVHNLNSVIGLTSCTTFLLASSEGETSRPDHTMVDGILHLTQYKFGSKTVREIEVQKFRGSRHLYGRHFFRISDDGIHVFPRSEEILGRAAPKITSLTKREPIGINGLDTLIGGGLVGGSMTSLLGPVGTGKTTLGACFVSEGARRGEKSLLVSLYEHPSRLIPKMESVGLKIAAHARSGMLDLHWRDSEDTVVDQTIERTLEAIHKNGVKRLFVDGIGGLKAWMLRPERITEALTAFGHELRALGVTSVFTEETDLASQQTHSSLSNFSAFSDNIFELRHVDLEGQRATCVSIAKTRESDHDRHMHELVFGAQGLEVGRLMKFVNPLLPPVIVDGTGLLPKAKSNSTSNSTAKATKKRKK